MPYYANGGSYCKAIASNFPSCQAEADPCTLSIACCSGLKCEKTPGGGWDMQCREPACVRVGDVIEDGQTCCAGAKPYHANGGSYCKAIEPACLKDGDVIEDDKTCCNGTMPYHANGGSFCKAIASNLPSCQAEADPCTLS